MFFSFSSDVLLDNDDSSFFFSSKLAIYLSLPSSFCAITDVKAIGARPLKIDCRWIGSDLGCVDGVRGDGMVVGVIFIIVSNFFGQIFWVKNTILTNVT